ncbi:Aldo/keto reductase [Mrakia frigida]|uniref:Aldo/keto reductase n=1 Tax=Mrakia frigida TaxID=29902 RepID=UPI003FCC0BFB
MSPSPRLLLTVVQGTEEGAVNYKANGMKFRRLGRSGLKVPVFGLGGWLTYGGSVSGDPVKEILKTAFAGGINFLDQAENYSNGQSELEMGRVLRELNYKRSDWIISTKLYNGYGREEPNSRGLSRKHILEGAEDCLARLGLDYVDIIFCHCFDPEVEMEEIVRGFNHLINQGKILYWGTSTWTAAQIESAITVAKELNLVGPVAEQPCYNLIDSRASFEGDLLPIFEKYGYGSTIFSPLARGLLTGKYSKGIPDDARLSTSSSDPYIKHLAQRMSTPEGKREIETVDRLNKYATEKLGCSVSHLALAWCLSNPNVSSVILGASKPEQIADNLKALDVVDKLTPEVKAELEVILRG